MTLSNTAEIGIGFLRGSNLVNKFVEIHIWLPTWMRRQRVCRAFDYLISIKIIERTSLEFSRDQAASLGKVVNPAHLFALLEIIPDGHLAVCLKARCPQDVNHAHSSERGGLAQVVPNRRGAEGNHAKQLP
jgi:hypothetical protein